MIEVFVDNWDLKKDPEKSGRESFMLSGRGGNASGYPLDDDNFVVLAGSKLSKDITDGFQQSYIDLRNKLISDGIIVNGIFAKDYTFGSSSATASVVLGRSANGRKEWALLDGRTYGKYGNVDDNEEGA